MDSLRQYINRHRSEFEEENPPIDLWSKIDQELGTPPVTATKKWLIGRRLLAAASVLLLIGLGFLAGTFAAKQSQTIEEISPEFAEAEAYYNRKIEAKKRAVAVSTQDSTWIDDLKQLEIVMTDLKKELRHNPNASKGEIIQAMTNNYNIRLEILDKILDKTAKVYTNTKPTNDERTE